MDVLRRPLDPPLKSVEIENYLLKLKGKGKTQRLGKKLLKKHMIYLKLNENMCFDRTS